MCRECVQDRYKMANLYQDVSLDHHLGSRCNRNPDAVAGFTKNGRKLTPSASGPTEPIQHQAQTHQSHNEYDALLGVSWASGCFM